MSHRIIYRARARLNAIDAAGYIADHDSVDNALIWFDGLQAAIESLRDMPHRFGFAREHYPASGKELRQMHYKSHRVIYLVQDDAVHILHVRHVAQDTLDPDDLDPYETDKPA